MMIPPNLLLVAIGAGVAYLLSGDKKNAGNRPKNVVHRTGNDRGGKPRRIPKQNRRKSVASNPPPVDPPVTPPVDPPKPPVDPPPVDPPKVE